MKGDGTCLVVTALIVFSMAAGLRCEEEEKPIRKMMKLIGPDRYFREPPEEFGGEEHKELYDEIKRGCQMEMVANLAKLDEAREALFNQTTKIWEGAKSKTDLKTLSRLEKVRNTLSGDSLEKLDSGDGATPQEKEIAGKWNEYMGKLDTLLKARQAKGLSSYGSGLDALLKKSVQAEKLDEARLIEKDAKTNEELIAKAKADMARTGKGTKAAKKKTMQIPEDAQSNRGHSYAAIMEALTWEEAKAKCEALGGHLVVFDSVAEANWVRDWVTKGRLGPGWIGLSRENVAQPWKWIDGSELNSRVAIWARGQPNNGEDELYVYLHGATGMHDGKVTSRPKSFICEWPGLREVTRLNSR